MVLAYQSLDARRMYPKIFRWKEMRQTSVNPRQSLHMMPIGGLQLIAFLFAQPSLQI